MYNECIREKERFICICAEIAEIDTDKIFLDDSPYNSNLDSLRLIELLVTLESEFDIEFQDEELTIDNYAKLSDLYEKLMLKIGEKENEKD